MSTDKTTQREKRSDLYELNPAHLVFEEGFNERTNYTEIEELAQSFKEHGQVNPIQVFKARSGEHQGKYVVRIGHRRTLAAKMIAENDPNFTVKAIKLRSDDEKTNLLLQYTSQTEVPLNSVEKGRVILRLKNDHNMSNEEIQASLGISSASLSNYATQARMPRSVQDSISNGEISGGVVNTFIREVREKLNTERADNFSPQVLSAVEGKVQRAVAKAKVDGTKGRKSGTVTGADVEKKPSQTAKAKALVALLAEMEDAPEVLQNFAEVFNSLGEQSVTELLASFE